MTTTNSLLTLDDHALLLIDRTLVGTEGRALPVALWVAQGLLALSFVAAGFAGLINPADQIG